MLRSAEEDPGLKIPGVYGIPCECGKTYIGQTNRTIETRCKEHMRHLRLGQPDKSALAQHALETGHRVEFNKTCRLARTKGYMDRIIKEVIEIKLHPDNIQQGWRLHTEPSLAARITSDWDLAARIENTTV
jgi:hypothetical protein